MPVTAIDPAVRRDGSCAKCRGTRPFLAVRGDDPFCSSRCCRRYHGIRYEHDIPHVDRTREGVPICAKHNEKKVSRDHRLDTRGRKRRGYECRSCARERKQELRKDPVFKEQERERKRQHRARQTPEQKAVEHRKRLERKHRQRDSQRAA